MRSTFTYSAKMASKPASSTSSGTSVLTATVMTAAVAIAVAAHPMKMTGNSTIRAVPRSRIVARRARYSSSVRTGILVGRGPSVRPG
jgi:hypothetical protein